MGDDKYITFLEAYRMTGQAKIEGVKNFMEQLFDNEVKFLLFSHHLDTLDAYEEFVTQKGIEYIRIDGSVPLERRHERAKSF